MASVSQTFIRSLIKIRRITNHRRFLIDYEVIIADLGGLCCFTVPVQHLEQSRPILPEDTEHLLQLVPESH